MPRITERTQPAAYQAALVRSVLSTGAQRDLTDSDLDQAALAAGLRPPSQPGTRDAVRAVLECPVDFLCLDPSPEALTGNQDIAQAVFDAADEGHPLIVIAADGRRIVMVPQQVEDRS
ncbi:hypothetical protein AB0M86_24995 [Streptomyces sp. NPDC051639]|uniref:hypothetical protein n=1 Tax=Streptomyces sp. NPDC051639 TaxID=3155671 RepID=UPI0034409B3A